MLPLRVSTTTKLPSFPLAQPLLLSLAVSLTHFRSPPVRSEAPAGCNCSFSRSLIPPFLSRPPIVPTVNHRIPHPTTQTKRGKFSTSTLRSLFFLFFPPPLSSFAFTFLSLPLFVPSCLI
ncbi:uncharacterized protein BP01DRAFT_91363 [Aspergillus saccharolyticus JOP 1030-1]|uniref:Uncharacterized protein n=1 Tax=Aspergillus saccharolyticus JOP 1030-1 TaxID=1450539 RepID=A0A318Z993_9EURO|nr:hypothetical protein BP01DRAFT_91363 [Aspergillus saccharolyticus JOP 1030-1]PYH43965.1 hypothetical protein BP01DRAFT_91363 [Aspergillus saccharolyticus JOP 1030-1]